LLPPPSQDGMGCCGVPEREVLKAASSIYITPFLSRLHDGNNPGSFPRGIANASCIRDWRFPRLNPLTPETMLPLPTFYPRHPGQAPKTATPTRSNDSSVIQSRPTFETIGETSLSLDPLYRIAGTALDDTRRINDW